jgi:hypothetical protein
MNRILSAVLLATAMVACGGSNTPPPPPPPPTKPPLFTKPTGTVAVGISIDDTANKVYKDGEMLWKGGMAYDATTNKVTKDSTWGGPWAPLYDDGPFSKGGHEPEGSVAGDHIFGTVVFVTPPTTGSDTYEYGLVDHVYNDGWIWAGPNGTFSVAAGATADLKADGLALKKFGTTDMQLTINKNQILSGSWDASKVTVKGSAWAWKEMSLTDDGTGKFVFTLSAFAGTSALPHTGLVNSGDKPAFVFVFNGKEYKNADSSAASAGVTAAVKAQGASGWSAVTVANQTSGDKNTYITIP